MNGYENGTKQSESWLYPPDFFELRENEGDTYQVERYAHQLRQLAADNIPVEAIDSSNAAEQYRELNAWNKMEQQVPATYAPSNFAVT